MDIYPYFDGQAQRFGDPMRIERILESHCGGSLFDVIQKTKSENPDIADQANDVLFAAVCKAFEIASFDAITGKGTTEEFQLNLLNDFSKWRDKKKATGDSPPSLPTTTAGAPYSGADFLPETPVPKKSATACGSISR